MKTAKLHPDLRNYLILNKIPLAFINFNESLIEKNYHGLQHFPKDYQILVLEQPSEYAFEVESLEWSYTAQKILLIYSYSSKQVSVIPLDFSAKLPERDTADKFYFSDCHSLKVDEDHIMITTVGKELNGDHRCSDIALFTTGGVLISIWKMDNPEGHETRIENFYQLKNGYWLANFTINENEKYKPPVKRICLLQTNKTEANRLSLKDNFHSEVGSLLGTGTDKISSWFSEEIDNISHFFVLASHYQCCLYRYSKMKGSDYEKYDKIADITLENSFIDDVDVELTDEGITIKFNNGRTLVESGSFHFSFKKEKE